MRLPLLVCGEKNILLNLNNSQEPEPVFLGPLEPEPEPLAKNYQEPEPLGKKSGAGPLLINSGAEAAKKLAGSPALTRGTSYSCDVKWI